MDSTDSMDDLKKQNGWRWRNKISDIKKKNKKYVVVLFFYFFTAVKPNIYVLSPFYPIFFTLTLYLTYFIDGPNCMFDWILSIRALPLMKVAHNKCPIHNKTLLIKMAIVYLR